MPTEEEPYYLTARQAAKVLFLSTRTVQRWAASGVLPHYDFGDSYRFRKVELEAWKEARRVKGVV